MLLGTQLICHACALERGEAGLATAALPVHVCEGYLLQVTEFFGVWVKRVIKESSSVSSAIERGV